MAKGILVCGLNGAGKSTLAKRLAEALHCPIIRVDGALSIDTNVELIAKKLTIKSN